jgi:hypothetical protein
MKTKRTIAALLALLTTAAAGTSLRASTRRAEGGNWRVRITLTTVTCYANEDNTGGDEFYGIGAFSANLPNGTQTGRGYIVGPAISINSGAGGVKKNFNKVIFSEVVPEHTEINGTFTAYDEDVSKSWTKVRKDVNEAMGKAAESAGKLGSKGALVEDIINAGMGVIDALALFDDDDVLGSQGLPSIVLDTEDERFVDGKETITGTLSFKDSGFLTSDFSYKVGYKIECIETFDAQPTLR